MLTAIAGVAAGNGVAGSPGKDRYASLLVGLAHIGFERFKRNGIAVGRVAPLNAPDIPAIHGRIIAADRFYIRPPGFFKPVVPIGQVVLVAEHDTLVQILLQFQVQLHRFCRGFGVGQRLSALAHLGAGATSHEQGDVQEQYDLDYAIYHFLRFRNNTIGFCP